MICRAFLFGLMITISALGLAQENVTTFGIQFKPIIPSKFFDSGTEEVIGSRFNLTNSPRLGYNFGMVVRKGFTDLFSLEFGINYTRRRYDILIDDPGEAVSSQMSFVFTAYEIPIQGLLYVQLSEEIWMNAATGFSVDMYPSDLFSSDALNRNGTNYDFEQRTFRNSWVQLSVIANVGAEWRTEEDGIFYFGASFHRPFNEMAFTEVVYKIDNFPFTERVGLSGAYLTFDFRYFFHEDPERRKKMKSRP